MSEKKTKRRIEIIDTAKCIAIFMVILGHCSTNSELIENPPILSKILYSIHMPLFFFLTGLSINPKRITTAEERRYFFRKTILTIAIPYLLWALIYCNFNFINVGWILYGSWAALGKTGTVTSLWYLSCLFCARIIVQLVFSITCRTKYGNNRRFYLIPAFICLIIGSLFPDLEIGYPWCVNIAFTASACILLGVAVRDDSIKLTVAKEWVLFSLLFGSILIYYLLLKHLGDRFVIMMMCKGSYGEPFYAIAFALLGGFAVMLVSMLLKRMADEWIPEIDLKALTYIGQHTMGVFLLHKPILQNILIPAFRNVFSKGPEILIRLSASVSALIVSIWLCRLIEYYMPELVGIYSPDIIAGKEKE